MLSTGDRPRTIHQRLQRFALGFSGALVLVLVALTKISQVPGELLSAALLTACALVLVGLFLMFNHRFQHVCSQRDQALAQLRKMKWQMHAEKQKHDHSNSTFAVKQVIALQNEIENLRAEGQSLRIQACHDGLTGLANRTLLMNRFHLAAERAKHNGGHFALLMIDLNDFKTINDNYGHAAGDAVLIITAARLMGSVRASDTVARIGGDEFVLLIEAMDNLQELVQIGHKLIAVLSDRITLDSGEAVNVGASVGLALYPNDGDNMNDLLHIADMGMYECKSTGLMSLQ
ncbi:MAG: diguanylate cyclase [Pseudomonadota bacterium]